MMKTPDDLMPIDTPAIWDGPFENLPNELVAYIISFLNLEDYRSFAALSEKHHQTLTQNNFICSYDPQLAIFLKVTLHFKQQAFGKTFIADHTPLTIVKEIIPIYTKVKEEILAKEIDLNEKILIAMLNCSLSQMNDTAKKELKLDFLSKLIENYFKIRKHFIFDPENLPPVFTDPTKLDFLITCIDQNEAGSFQSDSLNDAAKGSMAAYFYPESILVLFPNLHEIPAETRKIVLTRAEQFCIASYNAGALNALFLERLIYKRLISYQIDSQVSSQIADTPFGIEESVAEFLDIGELNKKSLYEVLGELLFIWLCSAPVKTLKVLKKLLASNTMDEVRTVDREELLSCLIRGEHSLEFLNAFGSKIAKLKELNSKEFLVHICNSPTASMIGAMLQRKDLEQPEEEMNVRQKKLRRLAQIDFPILMKILEYFTANEHENFLSFLASEEGVDLCNYFKVDYPNLATLKTKKVKPIDILKLISADRNLYVGNKTL